MGEFSSPGAGGSKIVLPLNCVLIETCMHVLFEKEPEFTTQVMPANLMQHVARECVKIGSFFTLHAHAMR
jgi:hypothetical protein